MSDKDAPGPWDLVDYEWDPQTGIARVTRERLAGRRDPDRRDARSQRARGVEVAEVYLTHPAGPQHAGWRSCPHVRAFVDRGRAFPVRSIP